MPAVTADRFSALLGTARGAGRPSDPAPTREVWARLSGPGVSVTTLHLGDHLQSLSGTLLRRFMKGDEAVRTYVATGLLDELGGPDEKAAFAGDSDRYVLAVNASQLDSWVRRARPDVLTS